MLMRHFSRQPAGLTTLWFLLIWYLAMVGLHFEPTARLWLNAVGMSIVVGTALVLSVRPAGPSGLDFWRLFRLYTIPFCVSSFAALVRDDGFYVLLAPAWRDNMIAAACCAVFAGWLLLARALDNRACESAS